MNYTTKMNLNYSSGHAKLQRRACIIKMSITFADKLKKKVLSLNNPNKFSIIPTLFDPITQATNCSQILRSWISHHIRPIHDLLP